MEKLIESIPPKFEIKQAGNTAWAGLCIRFSPEHDMWICAYGRNSRPKNKYVGTGYTVIEAVDDFKSKISQKTL